MTVSENLKKIGIFFLLGFLTISAFFIRNNNYRADEFRTIDEVVFYRMAKQVNQKIHDYNTIPYGQDLSDRGRKLPKYFFQPLFKHPPLFTYLTAFTFKIFQPNWSTAIYVSLGMGVLLIPLVYIIGLEVYDRRVAVLAALFMWMDPVTIISSQKVWMDTTIAFFTVLSVLFFILALNKNRNWFFILSGIAGGFAVNTKYTGILITFVYILFAFLYRRDLYKNKHFVLGLFVPFIMLLPWFYWNSRVYGLSAVTQHKELQVFFQIVSEKAWILIIAAVFIVLFIFIVKKLRKKNSLKDEDHMEEYSQAEEKMVRLIGAAFILFLFIILLPVHVLRSVHPLSVPEVSWVTGYFAKYPTTFYFGRLIEFSGLYIFSFIALLSFQSHEKHTNAVIRLSTFVIFLFFVIWGSYQSRYILSCIPFLILLGCDLWMKLFDRTFQIENSFLEKLSRLGLQVILIYIFAKMYIVNALVSFPNNMCYF